LLKVGSLSLNEFIPVDLDAFFTLVFGVFSQNVTVGQVFKGSGFSELLGGYLLVVLFSLALFLGVSSSFRL
jgi:hypothetical protein